MPHDHYGKRIMRIWESNWGGLSKRQEREFLAHECLPKIKGYQEVRVSLALSKHRKLVDVLAELERPVNHAELADFIRS